MSLFSKNTPCCSKSGPASACSTGRGSCTDAFAPVWTTWVCGHASAWRPLLWEPGFLPAVLKRSEEHTSELPSLMRISYAVFCLKKKKHNRHRVTNVEAYNSYAILYNRDS